MGELCLGDSGFLQLLGGDKLRGIDKQFGLIEITFASFTRLI